MRRAVLLVFVVAIAACAEKPREHGNAQKTRDKPMQFTEADSGKATKIAVGKSFDVVLEGNPTTGFQWQVGAIEGDAVRQNGKAEYVQKKHPPKMTGVGGAFIFHFDATGTGTSKIRLVYVRPWEKQTQPVKTFELTMEAGD